MHFIMSPRVHTDFSPLWFSAQALLNGGDPYGLVGPGRVFHSAYPVLYPAPAFVMSLPFAGLSEHWANLAFVFVSAFLLAYGITTDGWHRLPLFVSLTFVASLVSAQLSILLTAAVFLPAVAAIAAAKPQAALPIVATAASPLTSKAALIGGAVMLAISFAFLPEWPAEWWAQVRDAHQLTAPITRIGGFTIALVLLRWRRPEAWLVLMLACTPQTWYPYNALVLLALPNTFRESCALSLVASCGVLLGLILVDNWQGQEANRVLGNLMVATAYLPATMMILRRPNEGRPPGWLLLAGRSGTQSRRDALDFAQ